MSDARAPIRTNRLPIVGLVPERTTTAAAPASPVLGQLYFDQDLNVMRQKLAAAVVSFIMEGDTRLTNSRTPTGAAGGALSGTYPNPDIADGGISSLLKFASVLRGSGATANAGTAADNALALRALGYSSGYAMPGTATLSSIGAPTTDVFFGNFQVKNVGTPTANNDATNKAYVDNAVAAAVQGLTVKGAARARSAGANVTISNPGTAVFDGVTLNNGERLLLVNQSTSSENGIYIFNGSGAALTRANDSDTGAELQGAFVFVSEGSQYANTGWYQTSDSITIGTTPIIWTQFSGAGTYLAGNGLFLSGNVFAVSVDGTTIDINGGNLRIKPGGVSTTQLADSAVTTAKLADGSVALNGAKVSGALPVANGGTGASTPSQARFNLGACAFFSTTSPALTADTYSANITHNLSNQYPTVTVWDPSTSELVEVDVKTVSNQAVQIRSGIAAAAGAYVVAFAG